ncbi:MAG: hypothetical protein HPY55_10050 [Firmicutes bacterium]|nr:hypothetical protein [Bacillota bacterium]
MAGKFEPSYVKNKLSARLLSIAVFWAGFLAIYFGGMVGGSATANTLGLLAMLGAAILVLAT